MIGQDLARGRIRRVVVLVEMDDAAETKHGFELTDVDSCRWERTDLGGDARGRITVSGRLYRKTKDALSYEIEQAMAALPPGGDDHAETT